MGVGAGSAVYPWCQRWQIVTNNYLEFWLRYASWLQYAEVEGVDFELVGDCKEWDWLKPMVRVILRFLEGHEMNPRGKKKVDRI